MTSSRIYYIAKRVAIFIPQLLGIVTVVFVISRVLPGNPAYLMAGPLAPKETVRAITHDLGLDQSIWHQYTRYLTRLAHGDLGQSTVTSQPVTKDLTQRMPASLELVVAALIVALLVALPIGYITASRPRGAASRVSTGYGFLAGALPDFWWGLMLLFFFYAILGFAPAPVGRLPLGTAAPPHVTGAYTLDSLLSGKFSLFAESLKQLALPVITLAFIYTGPILKIARSTMRDILGSPFIVYARASGVRPSIVARYALRNSAPPVMTMAGLVFVYLLSGDVLIEQVFSWGGLGQYAVQAVQNSDYMALSGSVLATATLALIVYLALDVAHLFVDPRIEA